MSRTAPDVQLRNAVAAGCYFECEELVKKWQNLPMLDQEGAPSEVDLRVAEALTAERVAAAAKATAAAARLGGNSVAAAAAKSAAAAGMVRASNVTAVSIACSKNALTYLEMLVSKGASVNKAESVNLETPLMVASKVGALSCVQYLLSKGALVNAVNARGRSALMIACENKQVYCLAPLLAAYADLDIEDVDGDTAAYSAIDVDDNLCLDMLLNADCDPNRIDRDGHTLVSYAVITGRTKCLASLVSIPEFDINKFGESLGGGDSLLHLAVVANQHEALRILLECKGVEINAKNSNGYTAIALARYYGYSECLNLLYYKGAVEEQSCVMA